MKPRPVSLLAGLLIVCAPALVEPQEPAVEGPEELRLMVDPSPQASKVTVTGRTMANNTFRLSFVYEPGEPVREHLGEGGFERLTFLIYSRPSDSLLALIDLGSKQSQAAALAKELGALTVARRGFGEELEATVHLPRPPADDTSIVVELLAFDRRAKVLRAKPPSLDSFSASSLFREMSLLEAGVAVDEKR